MPNADVKRGLVPVRHASGSGYTGAGNKYFVPAAVTNNIFPGDPVVITGDADAKGYLSVDLATATGPLTGVCVGIEPIQSRENPGYHIAGSDGYLIVADDAEIECEIQANASVTSAQFGLNAGFDIATGDTAYRRSQTQLNVASAATTATLPMQIVGAKTDPENDPYDAGGNAKLLVRLNNGTAGV